MRKLGFAGLGLILAGLIAREAYHKRATAKWMIDVHNEAAGPGAAPMTYFDRDWTLPADVSALGIVAFALVAFGLAFALVAIAWRR